MTTQELINAHNQAVSDAINALGTAIDALGQVKAVADEIHDAAIASELNNVDGSATPQKQAVMDFGAAVKYRVENVVTVIEHIQDARRLLTKNKQH